MPPADDPIQNAMLRDRHALRRKQRDLKKASEEKRVKLQQDFDDRLAKSIATTESRRAKSPAIEFTQDLPIMAWREEIVDTIRNHQVVVISGETGSGKSTQLPKFCLDAGFGIHGLIGHTQPRRIAARTIAQRVSDEIGSPLGEAVGFKIRFTDTTKDHTFVKLMTDGILLAETQRDRFLEQYEVIIIDEAHERSLNIDFLLGYIKQSMAKRPDLKIIITSATIDTQRFAEHFSGPENPVPIINVEGRTYPVDIVYRDPAETTGMKNPDVHEAIVEAVKDRARNDDGDMLVFLPTENDIRAVSRKLKGACTQGSALSNKT